MPRFYVEHEGKWNILSTISDEYLFEEFIDFDILKQAVLGETVVERDRELDSLLTNKPKLNKMSYDDAQNYLEEMRAEFEMEVDER